MAQISKFEDLIAWQKARTLTRDIYLITQQGAFSKDFGLSNQMQRATVSIMSNIAEGYERGTRNEFYRFLSIAKASCVELRSQLYIAFDIDYLAQANLTNFVNRPKKSDALSVAYVYPSNQIREKGNINDSPLITHHSSL